MSHYHTHATKVQTLRIQDVVKWKLEDSCWENYLILGRSVVSIHGWTKMDHVSLHLRIKQL